MRVYPPLKLMVFVDDIKLLSWRVNQEVLQAVPEVVCELRDEIQRAKFKLSLTE